MLTARARVHPRRDPDRVRLCGRLLSDDAPRYQARYDEGLAAIRPEQALRDGLRTVVDLAFEGARHLTCPLPGALTEVPLRVHARYHRDEVLAALGYASFDRRPNSFRKGVLYEPSRNIHAFLVTLQKSEADYSPTTLYRDYPISPRLFHGESQSVTTTASKTGQRYLTGRSNVLLFVRQQKLDEFGTAPYLFLGPATYVSHQGRQLIGVVGLRRTRGTRHSRPGLQATISVNRPCPLLRPSSSPRRPTGASAARSWVRRSLEPRLVAPRLRGHES